MRERTACTIGVAMHRAALNTSSPKSDPHRRASVEDRVRAVVDEIYLLGAAHALAVFLATRGNGSASDDDVRQICDFIDRGVH